MPTLQVRDLDSAVYERLREEARREHRSLAQQAAVILERVLIEGDNPKRRRSALLKSIASATEMPWPDSLRDPADLIREDRDR